MTHTRVPPPYWNAHTPRYARATATFAAIARQIASVIPLARLDYVATARDRALGVPSSTRQIDARALSKMIAASATRVVVNAANTSRTQRVPAKKPMAGGKVRATRDGLGTRATDRYLQRGFPVDRARVRRGGARARARACGGW